MRGNDYPGKLVVCEGLDGAGKSSAVEAIERWSTSRPDIEVVTSAEPTPMWTGDTVYEALEKDTDAATDFFLFCADRREHTLKIARNLRAGNIVVTDRYVDSTRAYQTHRVADALDMSYDDARRYVDEIMLPWTIEPDLTFYVDISVDTALERCDRADKFETRKNLERVKEAYTEMYSHCEPSHRIVNGEVSESYTRHQAVNAVKSVVTDANRNTDSRKRTDGERRTYADAVGSREGEE
jgi:dTMP kinase